MIALLKSKITYIMRKSELADMADIEYRFEGDTGYARDGIDALDHLFWAAMCHLDNLQVTGIDGHPEIDRLRFNMKKDAALLDFIVRETARGSTRVREVIREVEPEEVAKLQKKVAELDEKVSSQKQTVENATRMVTDSDEKVKKAEEQAKYAQQRLRDTEIRVGQLTDERDKALARVGTLILRIDELEKQVEILSPPNIELGQRKLKI
jgi:hypothetical protein